MPSVYPLLFHANLHETVWGGLRLEPLKRMSPSGRPQGESWEVSAVPTSESVVSNGPEAGRTLSQVTAAWGDALLGRRVSAASGGQFPLLVKFIDAARQLSIQVHPSDEIAQRRHGSMGKTEVWYVMDAAPGASVLVGLHERLTPGDIRRRVADGSIVTALTRYEAHVGDVFFIPAGRIHALCGGVMVCEVQQSSDVTYRLFDYNRLGLDGRPRQLHLEEALEAIDYEVSEDYRTHYTPEAEAATMLSHCESFTVNLLHTHGTLQRHLLDKDSFVCLSCIEGTCRLTTVDGQEVTVGQGASCLVPAVLADFSVEALHGRPVKLIETWA